MTVLAAWLLADFITGVIHWLEDRVLDENSKLKFIKEIAEDNTRHHNKPYSLCTTSLWQNINTSVIFTWPIAGILYVCQAHTIVWLSVVFATFGNLVHRYAHEKTNKTPRTIRIFQAVGIFSSKSHHAGHHYRHGIVVKKKMASHRYCVMTDYLNPILDYINFFGTLEKILGIKRNVL